MSREQAIVEDFPVTPDREKDPALFTDELKNDEQIAEDLAAEEAKKPIPFTLMNQQLPAMMAVRAFEAVFSDKKGIILLRARDSTWSITAFQVNLANWLSKSKDVVILTNKNSITCVRDYTSRLIRPAVPKNIEILNVADKTYTKLIREFADDTTAIVIDGNVFDNPSDWQRTLRLVINKRCFVITHRMDARFLGRSQWMSKIEGTSNKTEVAEWIVEVYQTYPYILEVGKTPLAKLYKKMF